MSVLQSRIPVLFSVAFAVSIIVFLGAKITHETVPIGALHAAIGALYLCWLFVEFKIAKTELGLGQTQADRGTMEFYALGRAAVVISGLAFSTRISSPLEIATGLVLLIGGVAVRLVSIQTLGRFYSHRVRIAQAHVVVDHGPYRLIRHPAYAGMILSHIGFVILFFNPVSAIILLFWFIPAIAVRIRLEERALFEVNGYSDYARFHKRLIPHVW